MAYKYTVIISTYADQQTHDIQIASGTASTITPGTASTIARRRNRVHRIVVISEKKVQISLLTCWMKRKFLRRLNFNVGTNHGEFTGVKGDLSWVISVVDVELDYHVGARRCLEPDYAKALENYVKHSTAGFDVNI